MNLTVDELLLVANYFADWPGTCLLYSGGRLETAERSFLALFPLKTVAVYGRDLIYGENKVSYADPWTGLQDLLFNSLPPHAYAFGFMGYEMGCFADPDKLLPYQPNGWTPDAYWEQCALVLIYDHAAQQAQVKVDPSWVSSQLDSQTKAWIERLSSAEGWKVFLSFLASLEPHEQPLLPSLHMPFIPHRKALYLEAIEQAKEQIRAGEIYQVNLSQSFTFEGHRRPFDVFYLASQLNPAPFSAYLKTAAYALVSTSPERFLQKKSDKLETRPIKGTMRRGKTLEEDEWLKKQLLSSSKEKAELLMITDLMRNDLGKVSQVGSVETQEIWRCESYRNVFHLLSVIRSRALDGLSPLSLIRACFPGGSITGCPKLRAMEVIQELEKKPRGIYTGSLGYITGSQDFDLNIAIRTLLFTQDQIHLRLGGGIVIDSVPEQEFEETLIKGESLFKILQEGPTW